MSKVPASRVEEDFKDPFVVQVMRHGKWETVQRFQTQRRAVKLKRELAADPEERVRLVVFLGRPLKKES